MSLRHNLIATLSMTLLPPARLIVGTWFLAAAAGMLLRGDQVVAAMLIAAAATALLLGRALEPSMAVLAGGAAGMWLAGDGTGLFASPENSAAMLAGLALLSTLQRRRHVGPSGGNLAAAPGKPGQRPDNMFVDLWEEPAKSDLGQAA